MTDLLRMKMHACLEARAHATACTIDNQSAQAGTELWIITKAGIQTHSTFQEVSAMLQWMEDCGLSNICIEYFGKVDLARAFS